MIVGDGVELIRVMGHWKLDLECDCFGCAEVQDRRLDVRELLEWIRRYAPELLKEE